MEEKLNAKVTITGSPDNIERLYQKLHIEEIGDNHTHSGFNKRGELTYETSRITVQCTGEEPDSLWKKMSDEFDVDVLIHRYENEMEPEKEVTR